MALRTHGPGADRPLSRAPDPVLIHREHAVSGLDVFGPPFVGSPSLSEGHADVIPLTKAVRPRGETAYRALLGHTCVCAACRCAPCPVAVRLTRVWREGRQ